MRNHFPYDAIMISTNVLHNITEVDRRIRAAEHAAGRRTGSVALFAVSKTKSSELVRKAYESGLTAFGENYAQEMAEKARDLSSLPLTWHFIGPIQSNKTGIIAEVSDWVHSVDRLKIARRLSEQRPPEQGPLNILLQVKTSDEISKSGVLPEELPELISAIANLPHLILRGLMTIPAPTLHDTLMSLQKDQPGLDTLSMGMSGDLEAAIAEGSTLVRVGTDIFGARYN